MGKKNSVHRYKKTHFLCKLPIPDGEEWGKMRRNGEGWGTVQPRCCNFASVKASEPKGRHLRPVPKLVSIRSAVIYDPFRSHLRGVK